MDDITKPEGEPPRMKLYLIRRNDFNKDNYDEHDSALIRAKTEDEAREIAKQNLEPLCYGNEISIWEDKKRSTVKIIINSGDAGIIISSFNAG